MSIAKSALAHKHKDILRKVYKEFQAMFFSLHGPSAHWESVHRQSNALLLVDAARKALGEHSPEFRSFSKDIMAELVPSDEGGEALRYLLSFHEDSILSK
jgi:hypothetical protein